MNEELKVAQAVIHQAFRDWHAKTRAQFEVAWEDSMHGWYAGVAWALSLNAKDSTPDPTAVNEPQAK